MHKDYIQGLICQLSRAPRNWEIMDKYNEKYEFNGDDEAIRLFHKQRIMFVIKDDFLQLAPSGSTESHAEWFESLGWMNPENDSLMEKVTRGYVDTSGIYAYAGYDFRIAEFVENDLLKHLPELVRHLHLSVDTKVYLGLIPPAQNSTQWTPRKVIGTVADCVALHLRPKN